MKRDTILFSEFLPKTRAGFMKITERFDLMDMSDTGIPELWAGWSLLLKSIPDDEELFPSGKWATIQRIDQMLNEWVETRLKALEEK